MINSWVFRSLRSFLPHRIQSAAVYLLVITSTLLGLAASPIGAFAQTSSAGCNLMNESRWDGFYNSTGTFYVSFGAGDHIVLTTSEPQDFGPNTSFVFAFGDTVLQQPFPGTIDYIVPHDTTVSIYWQVFSGNVTWNVSCTSAPTNPQQCRNSGFQEFIDPQTGMPFKNQGKCIAYVNSER